MMQLIDLDLDLGEVQAYLELIVLNQVPSNVKNAAEITLNLSLHKFR